MRSAAIIFLLSCFVLPVGAQQDQGTANSKGQAASPAGSTSGRADQSGDTKPKPPADLAPPRSDDGETTANDGDIGESSSKDTKVDLSAPPNDDKAHPESKTAVAEAEAAARGGEAVGEFHPWDPHKAAKNVEVGDYYFKRKNYRGAESRYREALFYKENDAIATLRLAECLEKLGSTEEAAERYSAYLKIMPHGPESEEARKGLQRVQSRSEAPK